MPLGSRSMRLKAFSTGQESRMLFSAILIILIATQLTCVADANFNVCYPRSD